MDLRILLNIIREPGRTTDGIRDSLENPPGNLSRRLSDLEKEGCVRRVKVGGEEQFFPADGSALVSSLENLAYESGITGVLNPANYLRVVQVLSTGPRTLEGLIESLDSSERTVYRILGVYEECCPGLVQSAGSKEKIFSLSGGHPLRKPLEELAGVLFEGAVGGAVELQKTGRFTSLRTRILLHLGTNEASPGEITQQGLARALWTTQPIISKELNRLMQKGMITSQRTTVPNLNKPLNTYYLTDDGASELGQVRNILENLKVRVAGSGGPVLISDVPGMADARVSLVDVLNFLEKEDIVEPSKLKEMVFALLESDMVLEAHRLPELRHFFGRDEELGTVRDWLSSGSEQVLTVRGIAGIGKTTFMSRIVEEHQGSWNMLYYPVSEWSTLRNVLLPLANLLERMDSPTLRSYLQSKSEVNIEESIMILEDSLPDSRCLLIFDDVQKAEERIRFFLRALIESGAAGGSKLLLAGREMSGIFDLRTALVHGRVREMDLQGLDRESGFMLLEKRGIERSEFEKIFNDSEGHPLALEISESSAGATFSNIERFFEIEIASRLSAGERNVLRFSSVFRGPVPQDALVHLKESGMDAEEPDVQVMEVVQGLSDRLLLNRSGSSYRIHDIMREHLYKSLNGPLRKKYHAAAAGYYLGLDGDWASLESLYHTIEAGDLAGAGGVLGLAGESLVLKGYSEDLRDLLAKIGDDEMPVQGRVHFHFLRGEIRLLRGEIDDALEDYRLSVDLCGELGEEHLKIRCKLKIANIYEAQGKMEEAIREYNEELDLARKYKDVLNETDVYRCLALLYSRRGDHDKVVEYMDHARLRAEGGKDGPASADPQITANYYDISSLYFWLVHDAEGLDDNVEEYMEFFKGLDDIDRKLKFVNNVAHSLYQNKRYEKALEINDWQIAQARSKGHYRVGLFSLHTSILCLIKLKDFAEAERRLGRLKHQAERFKEKRLIFGAEFQEGLILRHKGDADGAAAMYDRAIGHFKEYKWYFRLPEIFYEFADLREGQGKTEEARGLFEEALEYAGIMKDAEIALSIEKRLADL